MRRALVADTPVLIAIYVSLQSSSVCHDKGLCAAGGRFCVKAFQKRARVPPVLAAGGKAVASRRDVRRCRRSRCCCRRRLNSGCFTCADRLYEIGFCRNRRRRESRSRCVRRERSERCRLFIATRAALGSWIAWKNCFRHDIFMEFRLFMGWYM